ncbi:MAG: hypothetical protein NTW86_09660 [Candidatus Sumerlaeota bacterium]|nr:hypothetical protein [Candidatus Sumerlaeota bacterium]
MKRQTKHSTLNITKQGTECQTGSSSGAFPRVSYAVGVIESQRAVAASLCRRTPRRFARRGFGLARMEMGRGGAAKAGGDFGVAAILVV